MPIANHEEVGDGAVAGRREDVVLHHHLRLLLYQVEQVLLQDDALEGFRVGDELHEAVRFAAG